MATHVIKTPTKLDKIKLIRSEDVVFKDTMSKIPVSETDDIGLNKLIQDNFQNIILKDIETFEEIDKDIDKQVGQKRKNRDALRFYEEFNISNIDEPIQILKDKIPENTVPISEVQDEVQQAYDKGFNDGQQVSISTYKSELETHQQWVKNFDIIIKNLQAHYRKELNKLENLVSQLSTSIAEELISHEIERDNNKVIQALDKAIKSVEDDKLFSIRLNPEDIKTLEKIKSELVSENGLLHLNIIPDTNVDRAGCIIETEVGTLDARIKTQLNNIKSKIDETIKEESNEEDLTDIFHPDSARNKNTNTND